MSKIPPEENEKEIQDSGLTVSDLYENMQDTSCNDASRLIARDTLQREGYDVELPERE